MSYERNRLKGLIKWTRQSESKRRNINDQSMQLSKVAGQRQIYRWVFGEEKTVTTLKDEPLVLMDKQILNAAACRLPPWSVSINPTCVFPSFVIILAGNNSMRTRLPEAALQLVKTKAHSSIRTRFYRRTGFFVLPVGSGAGLRGPSATETSTILLFRHLVIGILSRPVDGNRRERNNRTPIYQRKRERDRRRSGAAVT